MPRYKHRYICLRFEKVTRAKNYLLWTNLKLLKLSVLNDRVWNSTDRVQTFNEQGEQGSNATVASSSVGYNFAVGISKPTYSYQSFCKNSLIIGCISGAQVSFLYLRIIVLTWISDVMKVFWKHHHPKCVCCPSLNGADEQGCGGYDISTYIMYIFSMYSLDNNRYFSYS